VNPPRHSNGHIIIKVCKTQEKSKRRSESLRQRSNKRKKREEKKKGKKLAVDVVMHACKFVKSFRSEPPIIDGKKR